MSQNQIEWDDAIYSVGIAKMDEEHKQLVGLINALGAKIGSSDSEFIEKIINTLVLYTKMHFSHEEKILSKIHFEKFAAHKTQHTNFIKMVDQIRAEYRQNPESVEIVAKIHTYLKQWLTRHILVEDKEYGLFLVE